ncbi:thioesterase [Actinophytocola xinjiangensis]|uniref:Thioesterase n=1 Tax=Actinophytocola xinjiangensis TaxID=485602 RepID=A0A7Z1B045_9PSEU|nr:PaaI family thioesterase [Actinophytocola xinjiangensis]OLF12906.1 thioesterase [Actinophytocola xinjiangensis]
MAVSIEAARRLLASQPFSVLVGARLTAFTDGAATIEIDIREELTQHDGLVHCGVLAFAADTALIFAGGSVLGAGALTGGVNISYLRPARGTTLRAHAVTGETTGRRAECRAELTTLGPGGQTVVATATGTIALPR